MEILSTKNPTTSSSGASIVAISTAITSCSVSRRPISDSISMKTSVSPNSSIAACSVSCAVTVPSQSTTSGPCMAVSYQLGMPRWLRAGARPGFDLQN